MMFASPAQVLPFSHAFQGWVRQCTSDAKRIMAKENQQEELTGVCALVRQSTLHIQGVPLEASHLVNLEHLIRRHGMQDCIHNIEIVRCSLGKPRQAPSTTPSEGLFPFPFASSNPGSPNYTTMCPIVLQALLQLLQSLNHLWAINLTTNELDNTAFLAIFAALGIKARLVSAVLDDNLLKAQDGGRLIGQLLQQHPYMTDLSLADNGKLQWKGAVELVPAFTRHGQLVKLNLSACGIEQPKNLQGIPQQVKNIACDIFGELAKSFLANPNLKELHWSVGGMSDNGEGEEDDEACIKKGINGLSYFLEHAEHLETLSIIQCPFVLAPCFYAQANHRLLLALASSPVLERLAIEDCGMCFDMVHQFCKIFLMGNTTLQHLDLQFNYLGCGGHEAIMKCLPHLKHLRSLELEGDTLEDPQEFVRAMAKNTSLTAVRVLENQPSNDATRDISGPLEDLARRNRLLLLTQNMIQDDEFQVESDAVWGKTLARLAVEGSQGLSSMFQVLQHKTWSPLEDSCPAVPPPRKRKRLSF